MAWWEGMGMCPELLERGSSGRAEFLKIPSASLWEIGKTEEPRDKVLAGRGRPAGLPAGAGWGLLDEGRG